MLLELKNIGKTFNPGTVNEKVALNGVSLQMEAGDFATIVGSNGAGKSTLLRLVAGILLVQGGKIKFGGKDRKKSGMTVGYMPQNPQTLFTANSLRKELAGERLEEAARLTKLTELLDRHPYDLSGGEQQRAAMAKLLLADPDIYLLDEPTKGIDAFFKRKLASVLDKLEQEGVAIVMVSHDVGTISSVVKSIVCVNRHVHRHDSNIITEEQLRNYDCPIQLISHGKVPHTVLASHPHDCCPHTRTEE